MPNLKCYELQGRRIIASGALIEIRKRQLRDKPDHWFVYQCQDPGKHFGELEFLAVGSTCTHKQPPQFMPLNNPGLQAHTLLLVGMLNLETGMIEPL